MSAISATISGSTQTAIEFNQALGRTASAAPVTELVSSAASISNTATTIGDPQREFVRVSSSIGRAASAGQLSRQEALDIYRQIASLL